MSEFPRVDGFEEVWRPPAERRRTPEAVLGRADAGPRARLARLVRRAPEVMVKVTGRTRDAAHLRAHMDYISRRGGLEMCDADGWPLAGRGAVRELADDWAAAGLSDGRRRSNSPLSVSVMLSMPAGTDPFALRDAAAAFAGAMFGGRFDYVLALHTDTPHPHVHLAVRAVSQTGGRLNPRKADLALWRERFAEALRDRGVEAEATPRRARGVTRKAERGPLRRIADRAVRGGPIARTVRSAWREAGLAAVGQDAALRPWERQLTERQRRIRGLYLAQARSLQQSPDAADRRLGAAVAAFVRDMPAPDSRRLALARALRATELQRAAQTPGPERRR